MLTSKTVLISSVFILAFTSCLPEPTPETGGSGPSSRKASSCAARSSSAGSDAPEVTGKIKVDAFVVLAIRPDRSGCMVDCRFSKSYDPSGNRAIDYTPADQFVNEACDVFSHQKWKVVRDSEGNIGEVYYPCFYSKKVGDHAICKEL